MSVFNKVKRKEIQSTGFTMEAPSVQKFSDGDAFRKALEIQRSTTALLDAEEVGFDRVGLDGTIDGTDYRLSKRAFGDLCSFAGVPASFAREYSKVDPDAAMHMMQLMIGERFHKGQRKRLVVDTGRGLVHGIVTEGSYSPIANIDAFDFSMSASPDGFTFTNGWMEGLQMRYTIIDPDRPVEPRKGDVVRLGISGSNSMDGDRSARVQSYAERLVCTNGMVRNEEGYAHVIPHRGDAEFDLQRAVVECGQKAGDYREIMEWSANRFLNEDEVTAIAEVLQSGQHGGNAKLRKEVLERAQSEAQQEGRDPGAVTVWNIANGVTATAHATRSLDRRTELETMGFTVMRIGRALSTARTTEAA